MAQGGNPIDRFLSRFASSDLSGMDDAQATEAIEMMAAAELKGNREKDGFKALADEIIRWQSDCESARSSEIRQWYKNFDMYQGRQFTIWSDTQSKMVLPGAPDFEPRITVNVIEPMIRTELAKTGSNKPSAVVAPNSNDISDILAARAGEAIWEWFYETSGFHVEVFNAANFWRALTGVGFVKTFFDRSQEDVAATSAKRKMAMDARQKQIEQVQQAYAQAPGAGGFGMGAPFIPPPPAVPKVEPVMGKIVCEPVSPWHIFVPDLTILTLEKQPYVIHAYPMSVSQVKMTYKDFLPENWNPARINAENQLINYTHLGVQGDSSAKPDSVLVMEAYIKPNVSEHLPQGGLVIVVGTDIVSMSKDGLPYDHKQYPFQMLTGIETGRFYRKSVVESVTPLQNEINRTYGQIIKAKNHAVNPQMFYDENSLDPRKILTKPGQYIPVRLGTTRPTAVPVQDLPTYVVDLIERIKMHMDDISGQHQVSRAVSPGADTAASAIALLQETDDNFLFTTFDSIEKMVARVASQYLSLVVQYWDEPRMVKVAGDDQAFNVQVFAGSDIIDATDVRAEAGSALPTSKAGKIATITEWMEKGFIPVDAGLEAIEMGQLGRVYSRLRADRSQAQRENAEMRMIDPGMVAAWNEEQTMLAEQATVDPMSGEPLVDPMTGGPAEPAAIPSYFPTNWYDNHPVHVEEHKMFAKSQEFQMLPAELQAIYEAHTNEHMAKMQEELLQQAQMQMLGAGGPVGAPGEEGAPEGAPDNYDGTEAGAPVA